MPPTESDLSVLDQISQALSERIQFYGGAVQTTVLLQESTGWKNLLTTLQFSYKGQTLPQPASFHYGEAAIIRRVISTDECSLLIKKAVHESVLDTGEREKKISLPMTFSQGWKTRVHRSEWSKWPADIFILEPCVPYNLPGYQSLVALDAPYYPSLGHVLSDLFGVTSQGWTNYFRGQAVVVLPDYRARISMLTIGLGYLKANVECLFLDLSDVVAKVYATSPSGPAAQRTLQLTEPTFQIDLNDKPTFASVALVCRATGEKLDEKSFQEGGHWQESEISFETSGPEIEQMLLIGESETIEFRAMLDRGNKSPRLAKTAVAFANTKGGVIVFGIDDGHHAIGCETKGMADTVTNLLRAYCEPAPSFTAEVVVYQGKELFLVRVAESQGPVYTVKEHGPFIRSNATNRAPTSREVEFLVRRRDSLIG